jgi:molybdate transport system substrate-binding protein
MLREKMRTIMPQWIQQIFVSLILFLCFLHTASATEAKKTITVFAAISTQSALNDIIRVFQQNHSVDIRTSYAASSTLAKQIQAGAPADIFISADTVWMDALQAAHSIRPETRTALLSNALVVVTQKDNAFALPHMPPNIEDFPEGKWCIADPAHVPLGRYTKQALESLHWWSAIEKNIITSPDASTTMRFVDRAACPWGIVYSTDVALSKHARILWQIPSKQHHTIVYPIAMLQTSRVDAQPFFQFLRSEQALDIFKKYGFTVLVSH